MQPRLRTEKSGSEHGLNEGTNARFLRNGRRRGGVGVSDPADFDCLKEPFEPRLPRTETQLREDDLRDEPFSDDGEGLDTRPDGCWKETI